MSSLDVYLESLSPEEARVARKQVRRLLRTLTVASETAVVAMQGLGMAIPQGIADGVKEKS